jgi:hypothetical protein
MHGQRYQRGNLHSTATIVKLDPFSMGGNGLAGFDCV